MAVVMVSPQAPLVLALPLAVPIQALSLFVGPDLLPVLPLLCRGKKLVCVIALPVVVAVVSFLFLFPPLIGSAGGLPLLDRLELHS